MKGVNTLELNEATMVEAVQEYLDNRTMPNGMVTVSSVREKAGDGGQRTFKVIVSEPEERKP